MEELKKLENLTIEETEDGFKIKIEIDVLNSERLTEEENRIKIIDEVGYNLFNYYQLVRRIEK